MKVYFGKEIPQLEKPQCCIVQAELSTGILLTIDGNKFLKDSTEPFILIFDSLDEAGMFAKRKLAEKPGIECSIYDYSAKFIERISK